MMRARKSAAQPRSWVQNWREILLILFLCLVFLTGGGARDDIISLPILRPVAALVLAAGLIGLRLRHVRAHWQVFGLLFCLVLLHILHLIPLPPSLWTALPGREIAEQGLAVANVQQPWRPLSLVPFRTWNSLFSLIVPFAALVLIVQIDGHSIHRRVVLTLMLLALLSAILGLMQAFASANAGLYLYEVTNRGLAVGLFANRNHNAAFVAVILPMIAYLLSDLHQRRVRMASWVSYSFLTLYAFLVPFVLLTGSRAGLLLVAIGVIGSIWLTRGGFIHRLISHRKLVIALVAALVALLLMVVFFPTGTVMRLIHSRNDVELRFQVWPVIWKAIGHYMPTGSGLGTFVETYAVSEPDALLSDKYLNHAHNDWLELLMDAGLPGALLLLGFVAAFAVNAFRALSIEARTSLLPRLGILVVAMLGLASFFDYPLRTPAMAVVFVIAGVWATSYSATASSSNAGANH